MIAYNLSWNILYLEIITNEDPGLLIESYIVIL
jgi:hypothetical protein